MKTAEVKTSKRIRHCFPRKELYHRFIHSPELCYASQAKPLFGIGNYLRIGPVNRNITLKDFEELEFYHKSFLLAIIDRDKKIILVNTTYSDHCYELLNSIPDNYKVFLTDKAIPSFKVLEDFELVLKIHCEYLINDLLDRTFSPFYAALNGKVKVLYIDIHRTLEHQDTQTYRTQYKNFGLLNLKQFVTKYKIKKYSWYKTPLHEKYDLIINTRNYDRRHISINYPSIKQIISKTLFKKSEITYLEQYYFYSKYCFGNSIPFKDVLLNWNVNLNIEEAARYFNKRNVYFDIIWCKEEKSWKDFVKLAVKTNKNRVDKYIQECIRKSDENYKEAKAKLKENVSYTVDNWRNNKPIPIQKITYRKFIPHSRHDRKGKWIDAEVISNIKPFDNTLLRLSKDGKTIKTSLHASVPLEAGITMYKMFMKGRANAPHKTSWTTSDFGNVKVGIYNLRFIAYKDKVTNYGNSLGYKEWLIQIGCHALWLDDINEFIKYYNLEKEFGLK